MKNLLFVLFALFAFCYQPKTSNKSNKFEVFRGTNIAHWLSQSEARDTKRDKFFTKADVVAIAEMGFDHVRLPIDEEQLWDEQGKRHDDAFQLMTNCIDWCAESNLRVIVDLHILR